MYAQVDGTPFGQDPRVIMVPADRIFRDIMHPLAVARGESFRIGGWFALWMQQRGSYPGCGIPVFGWTVGICPRSAEDFLKDIHFANEKAYRLGDYCEHVSSWETRDVSASHRMECKYGGAIQTGREFIFSFSGLSEHEDEMFCVLVAQELQMISEDEIDRIIAISDNVPLRDYTERRRNNRA